MARMFAELFALLLFPSFSVSVFFFRQDAGTTRSAHKSVEHMYLRECSKRLKPTELCQKVIDKKILKTTNDSD